MSMSLPTFISGKKNYEPHPTFTLVTQVDIETKALRESEAHWEYEYVYVKGYFEACVESAYLEALVSVCVAIDLSLTMVTFVASEEIAESDSIFIMSALLLFVLLVDVLLRMIKDGKVFFFKWINWLEALVCIGGAVMIIVDGVQRACRGPDCSDGSTKGASLGRAVRPIMRMFRVLRAASHIFASRGGLQKKLDAALDEMTDRLIRGLLGDLLLVPGENIGMKFSEGQFHMEKAQIRSQVFQKLHLPFTVLGGLIDFLHIDVDKADKKKPGKKGDQSAAALGHRLLIMVENVLLVVGPGHHQEGSAPAWDFEGVLQHKKNLLDLVNSRLEQTHFLKNKKQEKKAGENAGDQSPKVSKTKKKGKSGNWIKERVTKVIDEVLAHGMHVSVRNVEIRYEDHKGELSGGTQVIGGFQIDSVQMRAQGVGDDMVHDEEEFRVKSKWRRGTGQGVFIDKSMVSQPSSASIPLSGKPMVRRGVRTALTVNRVSAFLDLAEASSPFSEAELYQARLLEGMNIDLKQFLHDIAKARARERMRLTICDEVEKRLRRCQGKAQKLRVERLANVKDPSKYKQLVSSKLLKQVEIARATGDKEKIARVQKFEDKAYREVYVQLAVTERSVPRLSRAESTAAVERMRRLKDKVAAHRYLLMPCGCSLHAILRQPGLSSAAVATVATTSSTGSLISASSLCSVSPASGHDFWPPQTDIDVDVPCIPFAVDLSQSRQLARLLDYFKRWKIEDHRMMWYPPPHHTGYYAAFARWGYALRQVLHGIDPKYPWKTLSWIEMRRRGRMKFEYVSALCDEPIDEELVAVLQVGMPLPECITGRYAAAKFRALEKANASKAKAAVKGAPPTRVKSLMQQQAMEASRNSAASTATAATEADEAETRRLAVRDTYLQCSHIVKDIESELKMPASSKATQFQLYLGMMQARLLLPTEVLPRRVLVKVEAEGIQFVGSHAAPQVIWMRLAPPVAAAYVVNSGQAPEGAVAEIACEDLRAVFCGMPSLASPLRRLLGAQRLRYRALEGPSLMEIAMADNEVDPFGSQITKQSSLSSTMFEMLKSNSTAAKEDSGTSYRRLAPGLSEEERQNAAFFMQLRFAYLGKELSEVEDEDTGKRKEIPRFEFAVWTFPLAVNICHPLMKKLQENFKPPEWFPRWYYQSDETKRFWEELKMNSHIDTVGNQKKKKKSKKMEMAAGISGPLVGARVCGEVLLRGGMRGSKLEVYTGLYKGSWLRQSGAFPTGKMKIERVVDGGPQLKAGFHPSAASSSSVQFQSADGWWFADEAEALNATSIYTTGQPSVPQKSNGEGWAGSVAYEAPLVDDPWTSDAPFVVQEPIYTLPRNALPTWGTLDPRDGSLRSLCKPPVSSKGLLPPALPPDKRRSGRSMGMAIDCCRSLERNLPDPMRPALAMIAVAVPEDGLSSICLGASPQSPTSNGVSGPGRPTQSETLPLMTPEAAKNGFSPSFTTPSQDNGFSSVPTALMAERKTSGDEPWTLSDADACVEVLSNKKVGLCEPTPENLAAWYRSLGLLR